MRQSLRKINFFCLINVLAVLLFLATACQQLTIIDDENAFPLESLESKSDEISIVLIQHDSCPWSYFWCAIEQGVSDAAKNFNVEVTPERPDRGKYLPKDDVDIQKTKFDETLQKCPDGIGITLVDREKLKDSINKPFCKPSKESNESPRPIPLIIYNSNSSSKKDGTNYGIYIGQDDEQAGYKAGLRLAEKVKKLSSVGEIIKGVCIMQASTAENLRDRCMGFELAMNENGIVPKILPTTSMTIDPVTIKEDIKTYYKNNSDTSIFLTLGPIGAVPFYEFVKEQKLQRGTFVHGTFDLSKIIIEKIEDEITEFAVDQQPYLQGYLTVQWLAWKIRHNLEPYFEDDEEKTIATGPFFVDLTNLNQAKTQVGQYR